MKNLVDTFKQAAEDITFGLMYPARSAGEYAGDKTPIGVAASLLLSGLMFNDMKLLTAGCIVAIPALNELRRIGANSRRHLEDTPKI